MENVKQGDLKVRFNKEAKHWTDGCPIGNGRLGGMVWGGVFSETINLNGTYMFTRSFTFEPVSGPKEATIDMCFEFLITHITFKRKKNGYLDVSFLKVILNINNKMRVYNVMAGFYFN